MTSVTQNCFSGKRFTETADYQGSVLSSQTKGVDQHGTHLMRAGEEGDVVQIAFRVRGMQVDGWGYDVLLDSLECSHDGDGPGCSQQVAYHGLDRVDRDLIGSLSENGLDGLCFLP